MVIRLLQHVTTRKKRALPQSLPRDTATPARSQDRGAGDTATRRPVTPTVRHAVKGRG